MMNSAEDNRIDEFCRELALALRRITGLTPDSLSGDLAIQAEALDSVDENEDGDDEEDNEEGEKDDEHINQ